MPQETPLLDMHRQLGARLVPFSGWLMPLHYGSQITEHHAVRRAAGIFDVSHMGVVDITIGDNFEQLRRIFGNDIGKLKQNGQALYSLMLSQEGTILDDLIIYRLGQGLYRLVINAGTTNADLDWMAEYLPPGTIEHRSDICILSLQGPSSTDIISQSLSPEDARKIEALSRFESVFVGQLLIARTGYTGENGYEIMLPVSMVNEWWKKFIQLGIQPVGLAARDSLRLEAGLALYGMDMNSTTTPFETGLSWTIDWNHPFIGRESLLERKKTLNEMRVGIVLKGNGVLRQGYSVYAHGRCVGQLTSGGFSPTLNKAIGLARVTKGMRDDGNIEIEIRGKRHPASLTNVPFVSQHCS